MSIRQRIGNGSSCVPPTGPLKAPALPFGRQVALGGATAGWQAGLSALGQNWLGCPTSMFIGDGGGGYISGIAQVLECTCLLVVVGWDRGQFPQLLFPGSLEKIQTANALKLMQESLSKLMETEIFATMVFSSTSLNSKGKRTSDCTRHGHARAWDNLMEFMSFLLFCHVLPLDLFVWRWVF